MPPSDDKLPMEEGTEVSAYRALTPPEFISSDNDGKEVSER